MKCSGIGGTGDGVIGGRRAIGVLFVATAWMQACGGTNVSSENGGAATVMPTQWEIDIRDSSVDSILYSYRAVGEGNRQTFRLQGSWEGLDAAGVRALGREDTQIRDDGTRRAIVVAVTDSSGAEKMEVRVRGDSVGLRRLDRHLMQTGSRITRATQLLDPGEAAAMALWLEVPRCDSVNLVVVRRFRGRVAEQLVGSVTSVGVRNEGPVTVDLISDLRQSSSLPPCCVSTMSRSVQRSNDGTS